MKISKQLLKDAGILPKLRLGNKLPKGGVKSNGPHRVKIIQDKTLQKPDPTTGKNIDYVRYLVEENGEKKVYDTKKLNKAGELSYFVQRLAEINEGDEVILEMKKQGIKNYIEIVPVGHSTSASVEEEEENEGESIPINEIEIMADDMPA